jgi:hypothetical protein
MIAYLIALIVATIIGLLRWRYESYHNSNSFNDTKTTPNPARVALKHEIQTWFIGLLIVATLMSIITTAISYTSYVKMRGTYDATVTQYKDAVEMYQDKAVLDVKRAALVDFQYKGYQENMGAFIVALRKEVVAYNEDYVSKKVLGSNLLFWPMIIGPGDRLKVISIKTG